MKLEYYIQGGDFMKAGTASSEAKKVFKQLNIDPAIIRRSAVAMYEAEVNVVAHAYNGELKVNISTEKIEIEVIDKGPGIEDIELAMQEGYSTASKEVREMGFGAGMGLPNIKKNADTFEIGSKLKSGTRLKFSFLLTK